MDKIKNKIIKNFLNKEELSLLTHYISLKHKFNDKELTFFAEDPSEPLIITGLGSTLITGYGDMVCDSLLVCKKELMEQETGLSLFPTYSYWRMYTYGAFLKKHKDRPACEISLTVDLGGDKKWPIFIDDKPFLSEPGDAILYRGCDQEHWREKFYGDWYAQLFLHYVDSEGPNKEWHGDKRRVWKISK